MISIQQILKFYSVTNSELGLLRCGQSSKLDKIQINHAKTMSDKWDVGNQLIHTNMRKFKGGQIYPFDSLDDQNLSVKRKGSSIFTIKFNFWVHKAQKRSNDTAWQISNPPWMSLCLIQTVKLFLITGLSKESTSNFSVFFSRLWGLSK